MVNVQADTFLSHMLATTMLRGMALMQVKIATALLAVSCLVTAGLGLAQEAPAAKQPAPPPAKSKEKEQPNNPRPQPAEEKKVFTDRYGDPMPTGAIARFGSTRLRHGFTTWAVAFSP